MATQTRLAGQAVVQITGDNADLKAKLQTATKSLAGFCEFAGQMGQQLKHAGTSVFGIFSNASDVFASFDTQMRTVQAVTGATGKAFDALTKKAKDLGATTSFSASQVADGMASLGRMGFSAREIEASMQSMLELSIATGTELGRAAEIAANQLRVFGMDASDMTEVADIMSYTANASAQTLTDLGEALKMAGPTAAQAGMNLKEVAAQLGVLANMGIRGSMAGTALARSYKQIADPKVQEYLEGIGVAVRDASGMRNMASIFADLGKALAGMPNDQRIVAFEKIFQTAGSMAGGSLAINTDGIDRMLEGLEKAQDSASKTAGQIDSGLTGSMKGLSSATEAVNIALGGVFAETMQAVNQWATEFNLTIKASIENNKGLYAALGKVAMVMAGMGAMIATLTTAALALKAVKTAWLFIETALAPAQVATTAATTAQAAATTGLAAATAGASTATGVFAGMLNVLTAHPIIAVMTALAGVLVIVAKYFREASQEAAKLARQRFDNFSQFSTRQVRQGKADIKQDEADWATLEKISAESQLAGGTMTDQQKKEATAAADRLRGRGYRAPTVTGSGVDMAGAEAAKQAGMVLNRKNSIAQEQGLISAELMQLERALSTPGLTMSDMGALTNRRDALMQRKEELQIQYKQVELEVRQEAAKKAQAELARRQNEASQAAQESAKVEAELRGKQLSEEQKRLDELTKKQEAYNKAIKAQIDFEKSRSMADKDKIEALDRRRKETNDLFEQERRAIIGGTYGGVLDIEGDMERRSMARSEAAAKSAQESRLSKLRESDQDAYIAELRRMLSDAQVVMRANAENYSILLAGFKASDSAGGEMLTQDEKNALEEQRKAYESMQDEVDAISGRLRDAVSETGRQAAKERETVKSWGSFNASILSMIGEVNLQRKTEQNTRNTAKYTKDFVDMAKQGKLQGSFA